MVIQGTTVDALGPEWTADQVRAVPSRQWIAEMEARLTREAEEDEADDEG